MGAGLRCTGHDLAQLRASRDPAFFSRADDRGGNTPGEAFLAVSINQTREFLLGQFVNQIRRRLALASVHPHIEQPFPPEAETALRRQKLVRRDSQVGEDSVQRRHRKVVEDQGQVFEVLVVQADPRGKGIERLPCLFQRFLVSIQSDESSIGPDLLQDGARMSAQTQGGIYISPSGSAP